ncbi:MAG: hypothetical protein ACE5GK_06635 [Nitrospiria bacterium]
MRKMLILISLFFAITGCGDNPPQDAVVTGPADGTFEVGISSVSSPVRWRPLDFTVRNEDGVALPDIEIEFFSTGIAQLTNLDGNLLANPSGFKTKTDDRGVARSAITMEIPGCGGGTTDIVVTGGVLGTVGSSSHNFLATVTRKCSTGGP